MPIREGWDGDDQKRWKGALKEGDLWEREYGVTVGRLARMRFAVAVNASLRPASSSFEKPRLEYGRPHEVEERSQVGDLGRTVSRARSRRPRASAVVPLNTLVLPLDIARVGLRLARGKSAADKFMKTEALLRSLRDWMALTIMGPLCFLLAVIGAPFNGDLSQT